jgi:hypothetical protein
LPAHELFRIQRGQIGLLVFDIFVRELIERLEQGVVRQI